MAHIGMQIADDLHATLKVKAEENHVTLAEYVRAALHANCMGEKEEDAALDVLREQIHAKDMQIASMHEQIERTQQLAMMAQANVQQVTQQLDRAQLALEDMSKRRTVWQKVKAVFAVEGA